MSTVEIEAAIEKLPAGELRELMSWLEDYAAKRLATVDPKTRGKVKSAVRRALGV
jgi:hypothetical protein